MKTINLKNELTKDQEAWILKNIGPRMHHLHNSVGGEGWIVKKQIHKNDDGQFYTYWNLTFEDERYATFFAIKFST